MLILQQQKNDLEKRVKELEEAYVELKEDLDRLHMKEEPSSPSGGMLILYLFMKQDFLRNSD
jgi:hypothetical protein